MPVAGGRRYLTSTAVFLNEVIKLAVCMTVALYDVSKSAPPSMPATSLFTSLSSAIFTGDSWKLAIPAGLYTLSNSLQYIGLSNLDAAAFQVTYQLRLAAAAVFSAVVLKRQLTFARWTPLVLLLVGVAIVQLSTSYPDDADAQSHMHVPRSLEEWKARAKNTLHKRSATYEGIQEDLMIGHPHLNSRIGLLATLGACIASGLANVSFEKVLKDSSSATSIWIRNVQLAVYAIFPALFIGVVFLDGEKIAKTGFFEGYNWAVWAAIAAHAVGGIATSFCISRAETTLKNSAGALSIVTSSVASMWLFESKPSLNVSPLPLTCLMHLCHLQCSGLTCVDAVLYWHSSGASRELCIHPKLPDFGSGRSPPSPTHHCR